MACGGFEFSWLSIFSKCFPLFVFSFFLSVFIKCESASKLEEKNYRLYFWTLERLKSSSKELWAVCALCVCPLCVCACLSVFLRRLSSCPVSEQDPSDRAQARAWVGCYPVWTESVGGRTPVQLVWMAEGLLYGVGGRY